ncbi:Glycine betaine/carnitine/choline-binding protein OpuCC [bacterium HR33]|nr:Glycine betaine/carnitine/choline-binding protein OpuCC [bacterium HR33]
MRVPAAWLLGLLVAAGCGRSDAVIVGSKNFTESVILGELVAQQLERYGIPVVRKLNLGGTLVCHRAIVAGQLDVYVEYTGTAYAAILELPPERDAARVRQAVDSIYRARWDLIWTEPLGFENTFAILIRRKDAERLGIRTISDAVRYAPSWRPVFGYEFMERADGYRGLVETYGLKFARAPSTMDLGLTYRALAEGIADIISGNSTDGQIEALNLFALEDDRNYFPPYEAAPVIRAAVLERYPAAREALRQLGGKLDEATMRRLNYQVDVARRTVPEVVREFLDQLPR